MRDCDYAHSSRLKLAYRDAVTFGLTWACVAGIVSGSRDTMLAALLGGAIALVGCSLVILIARWVARP